MTIGETVTVRMSRGDDGTPWGFRLQGGSEFGSELVIGRVAEGSLADRAGLREGDLLDQLVGHNCRGLKHKDAQDIIVRCGNNLDLIVHRVATGSGGAKIWKPVISTSFQEQSTSITQSAAPLSPPKPAPPPPAPPPAQAQAPAPAPAPAPPPPPPPSQPAAVKVSLEHTKTEPHVSGFNVTAKPFGSQVSGRRVVHQQYNSPAPLYTQETAADAYLQQTGGLFGTDPNLHKPKESPSWVKSETLRLIQETEGHGKAPRSPRRSPVPHGAHQMFPHGPHSHLEEESYGEGRAETLHHTDAHTQSGSFKRLTSALGEASSFGKELGSKDSKDAGDWSRFRR